MMRVGLYVFCRKATNVKNYFHHCISRVYTTTWLIMLILTLMTWGSCVCVRFLHYRVILFPYCAFWKGVNMYSPPCRRGEFCSPSLTAEYLRKLCGILLHRFFYSHLFIYLVSYSFISINTRIFFILGYNPIIVYFLDQIVSEFGNQKPF